jgi:hypothetical protein
MSWRDRRRRVTAERVSRPTAGSRPPALWAYAWWVVTGAVLGLGFASILTIGIVLLAVGSVLAVVGVALRPLRNHSAAVVPGGLGLTVLYLAWLNRGGPGRLCETTGTTASCVEAWSPWPLLVVALLLIAAPVVPVRLARR